jgi:hypothetical protein
MHHLRAGVNAAVGAPSCRYRERTPRDGRDGGFQRILNRAAAGLGLPAEETAAVVLDS